MSRLLLPLVLFTSCATPGTPSADSARNPDAPVAPREAAAEVLVPASPLLDDAVANAPREAPHVHEADVDPVCGMKVKPEHAGGGSVTRDGHTYFFCSTTCRDAFLARDGGTP